MDNRNYENQHWWKDKGYWKNNTSGYQHVYVWQQAHQATVDTPSDVIHHINENKEDNRPENLQLMSRSDHIALHNRGKQYMLGFHHSDVSKSKVAKAKRKAGLRPDNTSGYKGVYWFKQNEKWAAKIYIMGKSKFLGLFDTAIEAARAYDTAARKCFGNDCYQNLNKIISEESNEEIRTVRDTGIAS